MRPDLERAVLEFGECAGGGDRAVGEEGPRVGGLDHAARRAAAGLARLRGLVARGLRLEPGGLPASAGGGVPPCHFASARAASDARITAIFLSAVKAVNTPSRKISIGALAALRTAFSSSAVRCAPRHGWRSTRACRTSSGAMSWMKPAPTTFAANRAAAGACRRSCRSRAAWSARCRCAPFEPDVGCHRPVVAAGVLAGAQEPAVLDGKLVDRQPNISAMRSRNSERTSAHTRRMDAPPTAME